MGSESNKESKFYVQSLNRTFEILDIVAQENKTGINVTDISKRMGLPISTTYRLLKNLVNWKYVSEDENANYFLGSKLMSYGFIAFDCLDVRKIASPKMDRLNELTKETIYLSTLELEEGRIAYIDKKESLRTVSLTSRIGSRNYINATANGKCLVSGFPDQKIREILMIHGMYKRTDYTITDIDKFIKEVHGVRENGYAIDNLENETGVICVAAPIFDFNGNVIAAMSISGINANITPELAHGLYRQYIMDAAKEVSSALGYTPQKKKESKKACKCD